MPSLGFCSLQTTQGEERSRRASGLCVQSTELQKSSKSSFTIAVSRELLLLLQKVTRSRRASSHSVQVSTFFIPPRCRVRAARAQSEARRQKQKAFLRRAAFRKRTSHGLSSETEVSLFCHSHRSVADLQQPLMENGCRRCRSQCWAAPSPSTRKQYRTKRCTHCVLPVSPASCRRVLRNSDTEGKRNCSTRSWKRNRQQHQ